MELNKEWLLKYECPSIAEYVSNNTLQSLIARYLAWKVNRKVRRFEKRLAREKWLKKIS